MAHSTGGGSRAFTAHLATLEDNYKKFLALIDALPEGIKSLNQNLEGALFGCETLRNAATAFLSSASADRQTSERWQSLTSTANDLMNKILQYRYRQRDEDFKNIQNILNLEASLIAELNQARAGGVDLRAAWSTIESNVKNLKEALEADLKAEAQRNEYSGAVVSAATDLKNLGNQLAWRAAANSGAALRQFMWFLAIGALASMVLSAVSATVLIRGISRLIHHLIHRLTDGAREVGQASGSLTSSARDLLEGINSNAAGLTDISSAVDEFNSMTQRNANDSSQASELMAQVKVSFETAEQSMRQLTEAMTRISASGAEIAKIIKTIDEIAFQTNLLALNASVEAARAGEAGAGFAVVADEVRNLATRSAEAAKSTSELLAATITGINTGAELVDHTSESFSSVDGQIHTVSDLFRAVAEASREQSDNIRRIKDSLSNMGEVSHDHADKAKISAQAARSLTEQAEGLQEAVVDLMIMVDGRAAASMAARPPVLRPALKEK
jgi:methyl-accepting chemotaxis protein